MLRNPLIAAGLLNALLLAGQAQEPAVPPKPEVKLNYLNVCTPDAKDQEQIVSALHTLLPSPKPTADFEESRGRAMEGQGVSWYIRLRREFPEKGPIATAQYSIREEADHMTETLVVQPRESKAALEVSLEDRASLQSTPIAAMLNVNSQVSRIKVERFGAASVGLSRCEDVDQQAYESIFRQATEIFGSYRSALSLKSMLEKDVPWLQQKATPVHTSKSSAPAKAKE